MKRRQEFIWTIRNAYEDLKKMRSPVAALLFVGFSAVLFWFYFALEPLLTQVNRWFVHHVLTGLPPKEGAFAEAASQAVLPSLLLIGLFTWLYFRYRGERTPKVYANRVAPEAHEGLIFLLGPYRLRVPSDVAQQLDVPVNVEALGALLERNDAGARANLRQQIFTTTWGTLWAAVQHHRDALEHCWFVSTEGEKGSSAQAEVAERLVQVAAMRPTPVQCHYKEYAVRDAHDVSEIVSVIEGIYTKALPALEIEEDLVIADITGGTAAMSAAMALVTVDRERKIEYLRQDKPLIVKTESFRPRTPEEIRNEPVLMMIETWRELVSRRAEEP
ncbi:MAG: hypothetical protein ACE5G0_07725 [Rhodothermales bacterium]